MADGLNNSLPGKAGLPAMLRGVSELRPTLRLYLFILLTVFVCEALVMMVLPSLLPESRGSYGEALLDASLLSVFSSFIILPLMLRMRRRAENAELAIELTNEGYWLVDLQGRFVEVNEGYSRMIGYSRTELQAMRISDVEALERPEEIRAHIERIHSQGQDRYETRHRHRSGRLIDIEVNAVCLPIGYLVVFLRDITERKQAEDEIHNLAFYDTLSGLPNRRLLVDRLEHALITGERRNSYGAVLFADLDNFKTLNDTRGHSQGDHLLMEVATRLRACLRDVDTVARQGGDEFVVLLEDLGDNRESAALRAELVAEKVLEAIRRPFFLSGHEFETSISIGITLFLGQQFNVDELLRQADTAMYQAKAAGKDQLTFFAPDMQQALETRAQVEVELRRALSLNQLRLYFQPQVDSTGTLIGAEVLARWQHPVRGLISPGEFIPLAEESGLILPIGQWLLDTACAQLKAWQGNIRTRKLKLAVNVSASQFRQDDFVEKLRLTLIMTGADPSLLKLELTESMVLNNLEENIKRMQAIRELGVHFSMDDFGTGHSSLANLKRLPLDQIKIDQSFVREVAVNASDAVIVRTIIAMATTLGLQVIAEGVENEAQRDFLQRNGCPHFQGYLFGRPMPLAEFEAALASVAKGDESE